MFKTPKGRFIFQLICSIITLPIGIGFLVAILEGLFKVDVSAFYNVINTIFPADGFVAEFTSKYDTACLIVMAVIHLMAFSFSGGLHYAWIAYRKTVSFAFALPIPVLDMVLGILVVVFGLFFMFALSPVFIIISAILDYNGISVHIEEEEPEHDELVYEEIEY